MDARESLQSLTAQSQALACYAWLFHFSFQKLDVRGVLFTANRTILLGIEARNLAWQIPIKRSGFITGWIPKEIFPELAPDLRDASGRTTTTAPFFSALAEALARLARQDKREAAGQSEILRLLSRCRTASSRYGKDGERPYFHHWRRVPPSPDNRRKITDHFGFDVGKACIRNHVTAVWSDMPGEHALVFLDPTQALAGVRRAALRD